MQDARLLEEILEWKRARAEADAARAQVAELHAARADAARSRRLFLERVTGEPSSAAAKPKGTAKRRAKAKAAKRARKRQRR